MGRGPGEDEEDDKGRSMFAGYQIPVGLARHRRSVTDMGEWAGRRMGDKVTRA